MARGGGGPNAGTAPDCLEPPLVPRCGFRQQVSASVRLRITERVVVFSEGKTWTYTQKMDDRSKFQATQFIAVLERLWAGSKVRRCMARTAVMSEPSSVIGLCTVPLMVLGSVLLLPLQTVPELHELTVLDLLSGAMNQIYRTEMKCAEQAAPTDRQAASRLAVG